MERVRGRCVEISRDHYRPSWKGGAVLQQCEAPYDLLALQFAIGGVSFPTACLPKAHIGNGRFEVEVDTVNQSALRMLPRFGKPQSGMVAVRHRIGSGVLDLPFGECC